MTGLVVRGRFVVVVEGECLDNESLRVELMAKAPTKSKSRTKKTKSAPGSGPDAEKEYIVVDEPAGLIFENEEDLFGYFREAIDKLEQEYSSLRAAEDFTDEEQIERENYLEATLDEPDEVWMDENTISDFPIYHYIKTFDETVEGFKYIASAYVSSEEEFPTFVFIHFPTKDSRLVENYQRGELVYDQAFAEVADGAVEGDALGEGDPLAMGLYLAMIRLRGEKDITQDKFQDFAELREETIENADEIWRKNDLDGNVLVSFIKEFPDNEVSSDMVYIAVTQEDESSNVHSLLFSFPTTDRTLVDRYRQGENLQAEDVSQESAH